MQRLSTYTLIAACAAFLVQRSDALAPAFLVHALAGVIAGGSGAIAVYPIDFVKSQLQTETGRAKYKNGFEAAMDIIQSSPCGPFALYRGMLVSLVGVAPEKSIKLSANDIVRMAIEAQFGYLPLAGEVAAGGIAGMTQVIVSNPLDVIKFRLQTNAALTVKEALAQVEGLSDLYQGSTACIIRDAVFSAILFPLYAHLKIAVAASLMAVAGPEGSPAFLSDLIAGSLAAGPAAFLSTPADVVTTRIQQWKKGKSPAFIVSDGVVKDVAEEEQPRGAIEMAKSIIENEGAEVLFSGSVERVIRSVPQFGVTLAMFGVVSDFAAQLL